MGYSTDFYGEFRLNKKLTKAQAAYLIKFSETRRMKRDAALTETREDKVRKAAKLPVGLEGEYFVGASGFMGQDDTEGVLEHNEPPSTQPGLWFQWEPTEDLKGIRWNGAEKFYNFGPWLEYLIVSFLKPWGYTLNGKVTWQGEDPNDKGLLWVNNNELRLLNLNTFIEEKIKTVGWEEMSPL